jgi:hypothetical protein
MVVAFTDPDIRVPCNSEGLQQVAYHHGSLWLVFRSKAHAVAFKALSRNADHYNLLDNTVEIPLHACQQPTCKDHLPSCQQAAE